MFLISVLYQQVVPGALILVLISDTASPLPLNYTKHTLDESHRGFAHASLYNCIWYSLLNKILLTFYWHLDNKVLMGGTGAAELSWPVKPPRAQASWVTVHSLFIGVRVNLLHLLFRCFITARNYQTKSFDFSVRSCNKLEEYYS